MVFGNLARVTIGTTIIGIGLLLLLEKKIKKPPVEMVPEKKEDSKKNGPSHAEHAVFSA